MGIMIIPHTLREWFWFSGLYLAGVGTLAGVAYGLRAILMVLP